MSGLLGDSAILLASGKQNLRGDSGGGGVNADIILQKKPISGWT